MKVRVVLFAPWWKWRSFIKTFCVIESHWGYFFLLLLTFKTLPRLFGWRCLHFGSFFNFPPFLPPLVCHLRNVETLFFKIIIRSPSVAVKLFCCCWCFLLSFLGVWTFFHFFLSSGRRFTFEFFIFHRAFFVSRIICSSRTHFFLQLDGRIVCWYPVSPAQHNWEYIKSLSFPTYTFLSFASFFRWCSCCCGSFHIILIFRHSPSVPLQARMCFIINGMKINLKSFIFLPPLSARVGGGKFNCFPRFSPKKREKNSILVGLFCSSTFLVVCHPQLLNLIFNWVRERSKAAEQRSFSAAHHRLLVWSSTLEWVSLFYLFNFFCTVILGIPTKVFSLLTFPFLMHSKSRGSAAGSISSFSFSPPSMIYVL